jgi:two-component system KDP operon response regulator KdpE
VSGQEGLALAAQHQPDIILLDLGLPDMPGREVLRRLREWTRAPVVILSVQDDEAGKIEALDAGADDYVTKPFGMDELLARLRAALRRSPADQAEPATLTFGTLEIDLGRQLVTLDGERIHLTKTEYALLEALVTNPGKLLTHQWLLRRVWGPGYASESHYLRVYVRAIRRKLGDAASAPRLILTEPGVGYRCGKCWF